MAETDPIQVIEGLTEEEVIRAINFTKNTPEKVFKKFCVVNPHDYWSILTDTRDVAARSFIEINRVIKKLTEDYEFYKTYEQQMSETI